MMGAQMRAHWIQLLLLGMLLLSGCTSFSPARKDYVYQEAFFLTTREDTGELEPDKRYNGTRGENAYGVAIVAIDPLELLSSFSQAQPNRLVQQAELLRTEALQQVVSLSETEFLDGLNSYRVDTSGTEDVLIFIHGYKRAFDDTVGNAAQLRYQLAFPGPVIAFSWPSTNALSGYLADLENLEWSAPQLSHLVEQVAARVPGARIHLVAHSLGTRALVRTLTEIADGQLDLDDCTLGEIILFAPDFDREIFIQEVAPRLKAISARKTLYVSSEDFPLIASAAVFQYPRLGDSRQGPPIIDGIETVDVSDAITFMNGHGYYEADRSTIDDLYLLIREGLGAHQRPTLVEVETEAGTYWRLRPDDE